MKYAYFNPSSMAVLDWLDTDQFDIVLPESAMPLTDAQWRYRDRDCWVNPAAGKLVTTPPPGEFYRLTGDKWTYNVDAFAAALAQAKAQVQQDIKAYRDAVTADYIVIEGHHFHSDANSRIQQMTLARMGAAGAVPPGLMWQTKNHGLIELTNEIAAQFEAVTIAHDMRLFATAQAHINAVAMLGTIEDVNKYDWSQGWQL
ncbi:DUF4376 domain-containing protein [Escherichia coli]|uniref:DUF4376 domain-containing protein n=2 Tax=Escherichia coli TaxID=562 RepID=UPI000530BB64|nr:DUF4376 domain-containing protein [Escherichia coli]EFN7277922.1 DUF4376 domain-containing protein [Escherichia coli O11:H5]EEZ6654332.1 DUF4376 domain-containing protein [Escherichia coli]EFN9924978.1 DUF4376 domain-containing protein [Escherichia coli]EGB1671360.1 DUF4376 domain-containing protein [Escherichia coli]EHM2956300.1 DUF4376 domain-containing protein [Escherichia coli]